MSDKQLIILLRGYERQLNTVLESVTNLIPGEGDIIAKSDFTGAIEIRIGATGALRDFIHQLQVDIIILEDKGESNV